MSRLQFLNYNIPLLYVLQIKKTQSHLFANRNCFCDKDCGQFGDCCLDAAEQASYDGLDEDQDRWICTRLPGATSYAVNAIYVHGKCSKDWLGTNSKKNENAAVAQAKCHMDTGTKHHYIQYIPVLSTDTNITYKNVYCAICNNDFNLKKWNVVIGCDKFVPDSELTNGRYINDETFYPFFQLWKFNYNGKVVKCGVNIKEFKNGYAYAKTYNARACKPAIGTCHPDWPDSKDRERCRMYASYMYLEWDSSEDNVIVYKNYHCAKCNYAEIDRLVCVTNELAYIPTPWHPLAMLFDFNIQSGITVGISETGCLVGEFYDPLRQRCLALFCGRLYKFVDGKCVPDETSQFFNNSLHSNCQTVHLLPRDYKILADQSVLVNITGRIYGVGEYELLESTNQSSMGLAICKEIHLDVLFKFNRAQQILSDVCLYISITCLILHIVSYTLVSKLRNLPGKNLLSLSSSLLAAQLLFLFGIDCTEVQLLCSAMAVTMHFFFLAYFFWMNVMAVDVCRTFSSNTYRPSSGSKAFLRYSCYAWWTPTILVTAAIAIDNIKQVDVSFR